MVKCGQIEQLQSEENILVLIMRYPHRRNWQTPTRAINHIIDNWEKIGEILWFDMFQHNT